jgi:hypothetical protein
MDEAKIFEKVLEKYRYCRDIINECDLGTEEGWVIYRDAQEDLYLSLDALLEGIPDKSLNVGE